MWKKTAFLQDTRFWLLVRFIWSPKRHVLNTSRKDLIFSSEGRHIRPVFRCFIPPSWKWSSNKADVHQLVKEISSLHFYSSCHVCVIERNIILLDAGCLYCSWLGHVDGGTLHSAFSSLVQDLKLATGCSIASHTEPTKRCCLREFLPLTDVYFGLQTGNVSLKKRTMPLAHLRWCFFTSREDKMNQRLSFLLAVQH